jgi:hypothetical protein
MFVKIIKLNQYYSFNYFFFFVVDLAGEVDLTEEADFVEGIAHLPKSSNETHSHATFVATTSIIIQKIAHIMIVSQKYFHTFSHHGIKTQIARSRLTIAHQASHLNAGRILNQSG